MPGGEQPDSTMRARVPLSNRARLVLLDGSMIVFNVCFRTPTSRGQQALLVGNGPHKADEFARYRGHSFLTALASIDQSSKAAR
jgi:hypothetical protein